MPRNPILYSDLSRMPGNPILSPDLSRAEVAQMAEARRNPVLAPAEYGLREQIGNAVYDAARGAGMGGTANRMRNEAQAVVDFVPVVGDAVGFNDAGRAYERGDYGQAALDAGTTAIGAVPGLGDVSAGTLKAIFAGVGAKTADLARLAKAKDMAAGGAGRGTIWKETGWFTGADGKWRFEIDDSGASSKIVPSERELNRYPKIARAVEHPALFEAYPTAQDLRIGPENDGYFRGSYDHDRGMVRVKPIYPGDDFSEAVKERQSTTLHELQHAVQMNEDFAPGAGLKTFQKPAGVADLAAQDIKDAEILSIIMSNDVSPLDAADKFEIRFGRPPNQRAFAVAERFNYDVGHMRSLRQEVEMAERPMDAYHRTAGEVEARNVQARRNMTPDERRATPPWETEDVPLNEQIVRTR